MTDPNKNVTEGHNIRSELGLPPTSTFVEGPPPRPVDLEEVRALLQGLLSPERAEDVESLIVYFREWAEAEKQILLERAAETRAKSGKLLGGEAAGKT